MASITLPSPGTSASIALVLDLGYSQNIAANTSTVSYNAYLYRQNTSGTGAFNNNGNSSKSLVIGGATMFSTGGVSWDFRSSSGMGAVGATIPLGSGSYTFAHNSATGKLSLGYALSWDDGGNIIGDGTVSGTLTLPDIPRDALDRHTGTAWTNTFLERFDGSTWRLQILERWNGSAWVRQT